MLIVTDPDGNKISALETDLDVLKKMSKESTLICPDCKGQMILRAGTIKIKHFSHKTPCDYPYHEPESAEHLSGKLILKKHFEKLYPEAKIELEYRVAETNQRSDIMILHPNGDRWAIEFQCSKISGDVWMERTTLYEEANVLDIWIFGDSVHSYGISNKMEDKDKHRFCFMEQEKFSCSNANTYLNTETNEIRFLLGITSRWLTDTVIYNEEIIANLSDVFIHDNDLATTQTLLLINKTNEKIKKMNESAGDDEEYVDNASDSEEHRRNKARENIKRTANERHAIYKQLNQTESNEFKSLCLKHGYNLLNFPPIFHIDFWYCVLIKTPRFLWQLWIYDTYIFNKIGTKIWIPDVVEGFWQKVKNREFRLGERYEDKHYSFAIYEYFTYLSTLGVTEQLSFKNSKLQKVIGDKIPIYDDVIKNSLVAVAIEDDRIHIAQLNDTKTEFLSDIRKLNKDSYNKIIEEEKNNINFSDDLTRMIPIVKAKRELVNDWEYEFLNKFEGDLKRKKSISFSDKQKALIIKVKERIEKDVNMSLEQFLSNQKQLQDELNLLRQKKLFDEMNRPRTVIPPEPFKLTNDNGYNQMKEKLERCRQSKKLSDYPRFQDHIVACDNLLEKIVNNEATKDDYDSLLVRVNNMSIPLLGD